VEVSEGEGEKDDRALPFLLPLVIEGKKAEVRLRR